MDSVVYKLVELCYPRLESRLDKFRVKVHFTPLIAPLAGS